MLTSPVLKKENLRNFLIPAVAVFMADRITKELVRQRLMTAIADVPLLGDWVRLAPRLNPGAAFGLWPGMQWLFLASAMGATAVIIFFLWNGSSFLGAPFILGATLGGVWGNQVDRLWWGAVVDFIGVGPFPIFNLADAAIVVGTLTGLLLWWQKEKKEST